MGGIPNKESPFLKWISIRFIANFKKEENITKD
jgi:hypothetical protein